MSDRIRNIQERLRHSQEGEPLYAAIAYIPLLGWIYPLHFKKDDENCQFHGRQGARLSALIAGLFLVVWFLQNFPLTRWLFGSGNLLAPILDGLWLIALLVYLGVCVVAAFKALASERWEIPYLNEIIDQLEKLAKK